MPHVLIVDDDEITAGLLKEIVHLLGWSYDTAGDGEQGLIKAQRDIPDLVLSDVEMPNMTGTDMLRSMRNDRRLSAVPVVLLSSAYNRDEALAAGCDAFVAKPFTLQSLLEPLREMAYVAHTN